MDKTKVYRDYMHTYQRECPTERGSRFLIENRRKRGADREGRGCFLKAISIGRLSRNGRFYMKRASMERAVTAPRSYMLPGGLGSLVQPCWFISNTSMTYIFYRAERLHVAWRLRLSGPAVLVIQKSNNYEISSMGLSEN